MKINFMMNNFKWFVIEACNDYDGYLICLHYIETFSSFEDAEYFIKNNKPEEKENSYKILGVPPNAFNS